VFENTNFGIGTHMRANRAVLVWSLSTAVGQKPAIISNVRRPYRKAPAVRSICSLK
jgi:hypothetical protein